MTKRSLFGLIRFQVPFVVACLTAVTLFLGGVSADQVTYEYDESNRVVTVVCGDGTEITYAYDETGNRTEKHVERPSPCLACHPSLGSLDENWQESFRGKVESGEISQETIEVMLKNIQEVTKNHGDNRLRENMSLVYTFFDELHAGPLGSLRSR